MNKLKCINIYLSDGNVFSFDTNTVNRFLFDDIVEELSYFNDNIVKIKKAKDVILFLNIKNIEFKVLGKILPNKNIIGVDVSTYVGDGNTYITETYDVVIKNGNRDNNEYQHLTVVDDNLIIEIAEKPTLKNFNNI